MTRDDTGFHAEVDSRRLAFCWEHRKCGGLRAVGWMTGLHAFCCCGAEIHVRFADVRRSLAEQGGE